MIVNDQVFDAFHTRHAIVIVDDAGNETSLRKRRCPCTARELVAIDALLERGDKYAERLAKECAKGGGILEGAKRRRKK